MAKVDIVMPKMGESLMEGTILKWRKKVGDKVEKDENILDIATDKVDTEVPTSEAGTIIELLFEEGAVVPVGAVIARVETDGAVSASDAPTGAAPKSDAPAVEPAKPAPAVADSNGASNGHSAVAVAEASTSGRFYSPVVMQIAQVEKVSMQELESITGTGIEGRVTKSDLLAYISARKSGAAVSTTTVAPTAKVAPKVEATPQAIVSAPSVKHAAPPVVYDASRAEVVQMDNMRKLIAEHMVRSKQTSAHVTSVSEADVTDLVKLVKSKKGAFEAANGVKLTYTPFFIDAVVKTLKKFPMVNASVDGDKIIIKKYINIGVAVALGENGAGGLIVPVVKGADEKNLVGLARSVQDLAARARNKKLMPDDIQGGTFTLTNYGTAGNLFGAPIINQPQVAILGTGAIVKRPVVREMPDGSDAIVVRSMMYLSLSYDHRIIDGALAGFFLQSLVQTLESYNDTTAL
jgi:2-oxoglutarate dehydrogenase E2 component (dihydrolipoamide succinyltransferase)